MQTAYVLLDDDSVTIEVPDQHCEVMQGVTWGSIEAIGTPAQWVYLVKSRRISGHPIRSRIGTSLLEEIGACLLGGHGIPAEVGLASYYSLKSKGAFDGTEWSMQTLHEWLSEPITVNGRFIKYRFAKQKARYLAEAIYYTKHNDLSFTKGKELRDSLMNISGIGFKTASWIARNLLDANDVAILDIHILRAGLIANFFNPSLKVETHYLQLEELFIKFSNAIGIPASELDAEIWWQFSKASALIHSMFEREASMPGRKKTIKKQLSRPNNSHTNSSQPTLFI